MTTSTIKPVIAHAWMTTSEMITMCGLRMRRTSEWTYAVTGQVGETLFTGTLREIKSWLRKTMRVV